MTLTDSITIRTTPDNVFNGLIKVFSSDKYFQGWHKDHIKCQWLRGKPFTVGSVLYVEEYLHKGIHRMKFLGINVEKNRKIEYKILFPTSIICPEGSFIFKSKENNCIFTATLSFRFGRLFSMFARSRVEAIKKHMQDEGRGLKKLVEKCEF